MRSRRSERKISRCQCPFGIPFPKPCMIMITLPTSSTWARSLLQSSGSFLPTSMAVASALPLLAVTGSRRRRAARALCLRAPAAGPLSGGAALLVLGVSGVAIPAITGKCDPGKPRTCGPARDPPGYLRAVVSEKAVDRVRVARTCTAHWLFICFQSGCLAEAGRSGSGRQHAVRRRGAAQVMAPASR